jgi:hypothetical protein
MISDIIFLSAKHNWANARKPRLYFYENIK